MNGRVRGSGFQWHWRKGIFFVTIWEQKLMFSTCQRRRAVINIPGFQLRPGRAAAYEYKSSENRPLSEGLLWSSKKWNIIINKLECCSQKKKIKMEGKIKTFSIKKEINLKSFKRLKWFRVCSLFTVDKWNKNWTWKPPVVCKFNNIFLNNLRVEEEII